MDQIPEIRVATASGKIVTHLTHQDKAPRPNTPQTPTHNSKNPHSSSTGHSLKLKDYLRLTTISKRSNSNSSKKDHETTNPSSLQTPTKATSTLDTQKSVIILKQEIKLDLKSCMDKVSDLLQKVDKNGPKLEKEDEMYEELVLLCELHRMIKEGIMGSLEKASVLLAEHKQKQYFKFSARAKDLLGEEIKKSATPKKRSSLYLSCIRPNLLQNSHS